MNVGPDHTFGILIKPDGYGVGDLLHSRAPGTYLRGKVSSSSTLFSSDFHHYRFKNIHDANINVLKYFSCFQDRMRGIAASIRQNLKKANFHNFENILQAFRHYDKVLFHN